MKVKEVGTRRNKIGSKDRDGHEDEAGDPAKTYLKQMENRSPSNLADYWEERILSISYSDLCMALSSHLVPISSADLVQCCSLQSMRDNEFLIC
jgi:hypothetical protein